MGIRFQAVVDLSTDTPFLKYLYKFSCGILDMLFSAITDFITATPIVCISHVSVGKSLEDDPF